MRAAGVSDTGVRAFARLYGLFVGGDRGVLASAELEPVPAVPSLEDLDDGAGDALDHTVLIRLNGGLGTTMGLSGPSRSSRSGPG